MTTVNTMVYSRYLAWDEAHVLLRTNMVEAMNRVETGFLKMLGMTFYIGTVNAAKTAKAIQSIFHFCGFALRIILKTGP